MCRCFAFAALAALVMTVWIAMHHIEAIEGSVADMMSGESTTRTKYRKWLVTELNARLPLMVSRGTQINRVRVDVRDRWLGHIDVVILDPKSAPVVRLNPKAARTLVIEAACAVGLSTQMGQVFRRVWLHYRTHDGALIEQYFVPIHQCRYDAYGQRYRLLGRLRERPETYGAAVAA